MPVKVSVYCPGGGGVPEEVVIVSAADELLVEAGLIVALAPAGSPDTGVDPKLTDPLQFSRSIVTDELTDAPCTTAWLAGLTPSWKFRAFWFCTDSVSVAECFNDPLVPVTVGE